MATYKEYKKGTYTESDRLKNLNSQSDYWGGQQLQNFTWDDSKLSDDTKSWQNKLNSLQAPGQFNFSKQQNWANNTNKLENMKDFSYDVNGDALYQQYKDQYITQGKLGMMDTMGQAAALTGGYGNSYAQSVGQQTYQGYLQQLTNKIPELYQLALDKYNSDKDNLYRMNDLYQNLYTNEYGQHRDAVSDYNSDRNYYANRYDTGYSRDFDAALAQNESYNSNITSNRNYYTDAANNLANREWGQYTDNETLAQKAIDIYNDNLTNQRNYDLNKKEYKLKKDQIDFEALEKKYEGYISPEEQQNMLKAENSDATKAFKASVLTPSEFAKRGYKTTIDGKELRFDNYTQYIDAVLEKNYKSGKIGNLTEYEVAYLKGYYGIE